MATKPPDLRKLKDQATKALEKKSYAKAAELYLEIAEQEEDPDWRQRAGEALRKAGKNEEAVTQLTQAASGYAKEGFLLKAIAVCKVVLQIDSMHTETQIILAELYAQRDGVPTRPAPPPAPKAAPPPPPPPPVKRPAPPPIPPPARIEAIPLALDTAEAVGIDDFARRNPTLPPGAPMDVVPLATVLGGRQTSQPPAVIPSDYGVELDGLAYEIDLEAAPAPLIDPSMMLNTEVEPVSPLPSLRSTGEHELIAPGPPAIAALPLAPADELDFSSLSVDAPPPARPTPPSASPSPSASRSLPSAPPADELDFSSVTDDNAPLPPSPRVAAPPPPPPTARAPSPSRSPSLPSAPPADELDFSSVTGDPAPPPGPSPPLPTAPPADELDFSSISVDAPTKPPVAPLPAAPPADELDFSSVMSDAPPTKPAPALPKIPLFSSLDPHELRALIEGVVVRDFDEGDTILKQGEKGLSLFVIVRGQVEVMLEGPPQKEIATLGEGAFFGELALLTDFPRSATVIAQVDTQCLEISRDLAAKVIADSPDVLKTMLRFFRDRMLDRFLNSAEIFTRFNAEDARALMARFKFLEIDPKARVVQEGQRASGLFLMLCGEAQVVQGSVSIAKIGPGDVFGEMSLLTRKAAMASIDTVSKCWALQLPSSEFQEIMLTYPQFLEFVSGLVDRRAAQNIL